MRSTAPWEMYGMVVMEKYIADKSHDAKDGPSWHDEELETVGGHPYA